LNDEPQNVYPVLEYKAPREEQKPNFLFDKEYPHARVVEFYAHWCPHCQHFKPQFIEFAKNLENITSPLSVDFQVEVHAVSCVPNKKICESFDLGGYPSILVFPAHSVNHTEVHPNHLTASRVFKELGFEVEGYASDKPVETKKEDTAQHRGKGKYGAGHVAHFLPRSQSEIFGDAHLSLDRMLRNDIFSEPGPLDQSASDALLGFLKILNRTLSVSSSMFPVIHKLLLDFDSVVQSESSMLKILESLDPPPMSSWSLGCHQHGTGYTCGLWTLFHIVTLGTVEWNVGATDVETRLSPLEVADSIRDVIEHFFQCDECRVNFLTDYDACEHDRCNRLSDDRVKSTIVDWKELPLWLYEVHNGVNTRVRREQTALHETEETSSEWSVQWPPVYECTTCWVGIGRWNEDQVYRFLVLTYGQKRDKEAVVTRLPSTQTVRTELHSDTTMAFDRHRLEEATRQSLHPSTPLAFLVLCSAVAGYVHNRKKKYIMKGRHKKEESIGATC
jgi:thiol oxidase